MDTFTEKEITALKAFRQRIDDIPLNWFLKHDKNLVRWLRARELNLAQAEAMIRKNLEWRKTAGINDILSIPLPDAIRRGFPFQVTGYDKGGDIVALIPYGRWDFRSVVESGRKDEFVNYINYIIELAYKFLQSRSSQDVIYNQVVLILDMEGFSIKQVLSRPTIELLLWMLQTLEDNHPECLKQAFMINAPKVYEILWAISKPLMTTRTLSKVDILSSNEKVWKEKILALVSPDNIPSKYGGADTSCPNIDFYLHQASQASKDEGFNIKLRRNSPVEDEALETVAVEAGYTFRKNITLSSPGQTVRWGFKTVENDIGFSLLKDDQTIISIPRVDSHKHMQLGTHTCSTAGTYTFCFDNSYSRRASKTLRFAILISQPGEEKVCSFEENLAY